MSVGQLRGFFVPETADVLGALGFLSPTRIGSTVVVGGLDTELAASIDQVDELDGLALRSDWGADESKGAPDGPHPNGVTGIDHVVVTTPDCDRTQAAFERVGHDARRVRRFETKSGTRRQTFFWLGDVICEVVGPDDGRGDDPARWWGLALTVEDIDATADWLGEACTPVKPAIQPGRRVTTLRYGDASTPILFISPHVSS